MRRQTFHTIREEALTYTVEGNGIRPSRTDYVLSQKNFETAFRMLT